MTRKIAASIIEWKVLRSYPDDEITVSAEDIEAMSVAIAALRGPVPDPDTGLVPCGCGGKAKFRFGMDWKGRPDDSCFVICEECGEQSGTVCGECIARHFWNRAMGWRERQWLK